MSFVYLVENALESASSLQDAGDVLVAPPLALGKVRTENRKGG